MDEDLGSLWGPLCSESKTRRFVWAHDGKDESGWVELEANGVLQTSFGYDGASIAGTWKLSADEAEVIEMAFGSATHMCRLSTFGRFAVTSKIGKWDWKKRPCSVVGWPVGRAQQKSVVELLGPHWGKLCTEKGTTRFTWGSSDEQIWGWWEMLDGGILFTSFGNGTWNMKRDDPFVVEVLFGTARHMCRLQENGRFVVEEKLFLKGDDKKSECDVIGWADPDGQDYEKATREAEERSRRKRKANYVPDVWERPAKIFALPSECRRQVVFVGLAGPSGVGKSTLAKMLSTQLASPVVPITLDWFFVPSAMPKEAPWGPNWELPSGVDFQTFSNELERVAFELARAEALPKELKIMGPNSRMVPKQGIDILDPNFSGVLSEAPMFVLVEGFLLFSDAMLSSMFDVHLWIEADCQQCLDRRFSRDRRDSADDEKAKASYSDWFRGVVWSSFEKFKGQQLANATAALQLKGEAHLDDLKAEALARVRAYSGGDFSLRREARWAFTKQSWDAHFSPSIDHMAKSLDALPAGSRVAVLTMLGSICPVTRGHVDCFVEARKMLMAQDAGECAGGLKPFSEVLGFISLNADNRVAKKLDSNGQSQYMLDYDTRKRLINLATQEKEWLGWEGFERATLLQIGIRWPQLDLTHFYLNGADDVIRYEKYANSSASQRYITIGRPGFTQKVVEAMEACPVKPNAEHFILGPELTDVSSTAVRQAVAAGDGSTLERLMHPDVVKVLTEKWNGVHKSNGIDDKMKVDTN